MPRNMEEKEPIYVRIPSELVRSVKLILMDPKTGRVKYGAMSALFSKLARKWVDDKKKGLSVEEPKADIDRFKEIEND